MSNVPASRREIAGTEFVYNAALLYSHTLDCAIRLPKRWTFLIAQPAVREAASVLHHAKAANSIWVSYAVDADLRRAHVQEAYANAQVLSSYVDEIYNRFPAREDIGKPCISESRYMRWVELIDKELALLKGVLKSDRTRFADLYKADQVEGVPIQLSLFRD